MNTSPISVQRLFITLTHILRDARDHVYHVQQKYYRHTKKQNIPTPSTNNTKHVMRNKAPTPPAPCTTTLFPTIVFHLLLREDISTSTVETWTSANCLNLLLFIGLPNKFNLSQALFVPIKMKRKGKRKSKTKNITNLKQKHYWRPPTTADKQNKSER